MHPVLFHIGGVQGYSYGFMIAVGAILAIFVSEWRARRRGLDGDLVFKAALWGLFAGLVGAKLTFLLSNYRLLLTDPKTALGSDGFTVIGGVILGILAGVWIVHRAGAPKLLLMDLVIPQIALAQGFGRIGCFLAGCCYGKPTVHALGVVFPPEAIAPSGISLWPTQLFSAAGNFLIFAILLLLSNVATAHLRLPGRPGEDRSKALLKPGSISAMYLILYGIGRFLIEFLRDDPRRMALGFTSNQIVCIGLVFLGAFLVAFAQKKGTTFGQSDK